MAGKTETKSIRWGDVSWGTLGLCFSLSAVGIDAANNYAHGVAEGGQIAGFVAVVAAAGLAIVPALAVNGWTLVHRVLLALCFAITGLCAIAAYSGEFDAKLKAAENANRIFIEARQAAEAANTPWLLFFDADVEPQPGVVGALLRCA